MPTNTPIQSITLTSNQTSVTFSNIDQSYTDLRLVINSQNVNSTYQPYIQFNADTGTSTTNYSTTSLQGNGSTTAANRHTSNFGWYPVPGPGVGTTGNFQPWAVYITSYSNATTYKSAVSRFNNPASIVVANAHTWRQTAPITSITITAESSAGSLVVGSTFALYGISPVNAKVAQASGGTNIYYDSSYVYHVFAGTGIFTPARNLTADILVVAGGGGSSNANSAGGGGAGGLVYSASQSLTAGIAYTCTVGAGGVGGIGSSAVAGSQGGNSNVTGGSLSLTAAVGGGYGGGSGGNGGAGGSGGGAGASGGSPSSTSGGSGTSSPILQGYVGGNASVLSGNYPNTSGGGGGGGYTQAGGNTDGQVGKPGYGGAGTSAYSSWGLATGYGQNVSGTYYFAGGGGGGWDYRQGSFASYAVGGNGGGANGVANHIGNNGLSGSGGGGGGSGYDGTTGIYSGGFGGSGVIIVRYAR